MNYSLTIKNWKWWVALPIAIPMLIFISIPKALIIVLNFIISIIEIVNVGDKSSTGFIKRLVSWVHGENK